MTSQRIRSGFCPNGQAAILPFKTQVRFRRSIIFVKIMVHKNFNTSSYEQTLQQNLNRFVSCIHIEKKYCGSSKTDFRTPIIMKESIHQCLSGSQKYYMMQYIIFWPLLSRCWKAFHNEKFTTERFHYTKVLVYVFFKQGNGNIEKERIRIKFKAVSCKF